MKTKGRQLTTADLVAVFRRSLVLMLAAALLGGVISYFLAARRASVSYTAVAEVYVQTTTVDMEEGPTSNEIALARAMARSCCDAIKNDTLCNNIKRYFAERAGDGWPDISAVGNDTLSAMMTATVAENSQNVTVTVTAGDGKLAICLANAVADEMERSLADVIGNCSITPSKWAGAASASSTFSKTLAIVGAPVGAFGAYAVMLLLYIFDPLVRDKRELEEQFCSDVPLLGAVHATEGKRGGLLR